MASTTAPQILASVDDHLGPADRRFFGSGFRRVRYTVGDVRTSTDLDGSFHSTSTVGVAYPRDWSRKAAARDLRPHFSTVDAIVLGAELSLLGIAEAAGLSSDVARSAHVRSVRISAAGRPQEDLGALAATAVAPPATPLSGGRALSRTDCRIGTMRVRCEVEHLAGVARPGVRHHDDPTPVLGAAGSRYHGTGFTGWQQHITDVRIDAAALRADATLSITADRTGAVPAPLTSQPAGVTTVDAFVTALQLGQVLLYAHDDVDRADSETLWMRQTTLRAARPDPTTAAGCPAATWLDNAELVEMSGGLWRTADIVGEMGGVSVRCAVTHRLPGR